MKLKTIKEIKQLKGKRVLLRVDFNVSLGRNKKVDPSEAERLRRTIPTIKYLLQKHCRLIIISHLGRPGGKVVKNLRLKPVADYLEKLLKKKVQRAKSCLGKDVRQLVDYLMPGEVLMLENLRFQPGEEKNSKRFAQKLAGYADIYVNDAFAVCHRRHASVARITEFLPSYAGLLLTEEVRVLNNATQRPLRPLVVIIGGSKAATKLAVIKNLLPKIDYLLLGGTMANTILKAQGVQVGKSFIESKLIKELKKLKLTDTRFKLPVDVVLAAAPKQNAPVRTAATANVRPKELILDIGPDTIKLFSSVIKKAKMIIWNGALGMFELPKFSRGTYQITRAIANSQARKIIGGGSTIEAVKRLRLEKEFDFISTGGGAMLELLAGKELPGIKPLVKK